jgi:hypothetical protein
MVGAIKRGGFGANAKKRPEPLGPVEVLASSGGKGVTSHPALIEKKHLFPDGTLITTTHGWYEQFLNGNWIDPKEFGQLPDGPIGKPNPADFIYKNNEQHRVRQAWIKTPMDSPILEVEINYPLGVLQRADGRGYIFRLALDRSTSEADRANNEFNGELKEDDGIVLKNTLASC